MVQFRKKLNPGCYEKKFSFSLETSWHVSSYHHPVLSTGMADMAWHVAEDEIH